MGIVSVSEKILLVFMAFFFLLPSAFTDLGFGFRIESFLPAVALILVLLSSRGTLYFGIESIWLAIFTTLNLLYFLIIDPNYVSVLKILTWFLISITFALCLRSRNFFQNFISFYIFFGFCAALLYIASPSKWGAINVNIFSFELRTVFGYFVAIGTGLNFAKYLDSKSKINFAIFVLCFVALIISGARGPVIMTLLIVFTNLVVNENVNLKSIAQLVFVTSTFSLIVILSEDLFIRYKSIYDLDLVSSTLYRLDLLTTALKSLGEFNIFGISEDRYRQYLSNNTFQVYSQINLVDKFYADSDFVRLLVKHGILTTLTIFVICYRWMRKVISLEKVEKRYELVFFISFVFMIFSDDILTNPIGWILLSVYLVQRPKEVS